MYNNTSGNPPPPPSTVLHDGIITRSPSRWHQYSENDNIYQEMYIIMTGSTLPPPPLHQASL